MWSYLPQNILDTASKRGGYTPDPWNRGRPPYIPRQFDKEYEKQCTSVQHKDGSTQVKFVSCTAKARFVCEIPRE